ncbi:MAG: deoxynucleoside kinase [Chloroflexota bacterium]
MGRLIAVVGNSGVGKTALTQRLCQLGPFTGGLEQHQARPFQGLFAQENQRYGLANQVDYLLLRAEQEASLRASDLDGVQDGGLEMDFYVFTRHFYNLGYLHLAEYELCQRLYRQLRRGLPAPEVFVSMTAPLEVIASRFARRGRALEIARLAELHALQALLDGWLEQAERAGARLVRVDASQEDPGYERTGQAILARVLQALPAAGEGVVGDAG